MLETHSWHGGQSAHKCTGSMTAVSRYAELLFRDGQSANTGTSHVTAASVACKWVYCKCRVLSTLTLNPTPDCLNPTVGASPKSTQQIESVNSQNPYSNPDRSEYTTVKEVLSVQRQWQGRASR